MYIDTVPNRNSPPAVLLRQTRREGKKMVKETLANLSCLPPQAVEALRLVLKGIRLVPGEQRFAVERSLPHGDVEAVLGVMRALEMEALLASRPCRKRDLVVAMIAQRLVDPCSKLATTRQWLATTLAEQLGVADADENDLYAALDWLLDRKERIERKLAKRHLGEGARVLFDVSSSSYHGRTCPLAQYGYNRDGEKLPCIVYGLLADGEGRPVAVETYAGNTGDPSTVPDQVDKLRERFGLERVVLVGDRGMLTQTQIDALKTHPQLGWISVLRSNAIAELVEQGALQMSLFDQHNLAEITSETYPGERLMVCHNPLLAEDRRRTRQELLEATENELARIAAQVGRRTKTPLKADEIGVKVGRVLNRFRVGKHFDLDIQDGHFGFARNAERIKQEEQLDGIYVIRTSEPQSELSAPDTVRAYKSLGQIEQAFRCIKSLDVRIRPIHHRTPEHVKAHVFLCMLAYYVEWELRKKLAPLLFQDKELDAARWTRDPVAKAQPGEAVQQKKRTKQTSGGRPVHSLQTLMDELATRCKNTCRVGEDKTSAQFTTVTELTPFQRHVFGLLGLKS
ncbi:MAG TPA: IS1634 family transposase [Candidatus Bathyarchaeia archaeon]|nr:IS1634 family transposase [Candidatus Bathyarchaeia archaeon]